MLHFAKTVNPHARRKHAAQYAAARDDASGADDGIDGDADAAPLLAEHKLGWRLLRGLGADGPTAVVEIELRRHRHQIHVGFVIRVESADIPPVTYLAGVDVTKIVSYHPRLAQITREEVFAKIMA